MSAYSPDIGADAAWPTEATGRMNRMYRRQRHIYDVTRRYYLLGRDRLIARLRARSRRDRAGNRLRNRQEPGARRAAISRRPIFRHRCLDGNADVGDRSHFAARPDRSRPRRAWRRQRRSTRKRMFGVAVVRSIMISYSLSMIPDWRRVLRGGDAAASSPAAVCTSSISAIRNDCPASPARCCCGGLRCSTSRRATISNANCRRWPTSCGADLRFERPFRGYAQYAVLTLPPGPSTP